MTTLVSPTEHEFLVFWVQLVLLLAAARGLGEVARRLHQPPVVGELAAGIVLGPSLLGRLWPDGFAWLFPGGPVPSAMLLTVAWIGVVLLLVVTGLETDTQLLRSLGRAAVVVAAASILVPYATGLVPGALMPDTFLGPEASRLVFALFIAATLTTSSLAVIAKILGDLGLLRRNFGQITVAAGMGNEVVGYVALGILAGLATAGVVSARSAVVDLIGVGVFVVLAWTAGQRLVDAAFRRLRQGGAPIAMWLTVVLVVALASGAITAALGVEAVLGAFVAGVLVGRSRYAEDQLRHHLEVVTTSTVAPIFFATAGLRVDLGLLAQGQVALWAAILLAVAFLAKFVGSWAGARLAGLTSREGAALGVGLNARGVLEVLIATVALTLGVFNSASYTIAVLIAIVSSMLTAPLLRLVVSGWRGSRQEQERLDREETLSRNLVVRPRRMLLPSRGGPNSLLAADLMHLAWPEEAGVTVLTVSPDGRPVDTSALRAALPGRAVEETRVESQAAVPSILEQAKLNYGVIAVGALPSAHGQDLFSPLVDELLNASPVPLVVVRAGRDLMARFEGEQPRVVPLSFRRILAPADGTERSQAAQEVAVALATRLRADVELVHVITSPARRWGRGRRRERPGASVAAPRAEERTRAAQRVLETACALATERGVPCRGHVRSGTSSAEQLVQAAGELDCDAVVVGADLRTVEGRPFVGHGVEEVLVGTDRTVVVVVVRRDQAADRARAAS